MMIFCFLILLLGVSSNSQTSTSSDVEEMRMEKWLNDNDDDDDNKFSSGEKLEKCDDKLEFLIDAAWTSECDVTCDTLFGKETKKICEMGIFPRCVCRSGFIRRNKNGKCIHILDCDNNTERQK